MKPEDVKNYFGSGYQFNKKTGMSHANFTNWLKWGYIPLDSQLKIEVITRGKLRASFNDNKEKE